MSQIRWRTEDGWQVITGWDRPLAYFFLSISRDCPDCDGTGQTQPPADDPYADVYQCERCAGLGEQTLFDNLSDPRFAPRMGAMTLPDVRLVLGDYLTDIPQDALAQLERDRFEDVGNRVEEMGTIGASRNHGT